MKSESEKLGKNLKRIRTEKEISQGDIARSRGKVPTIEFIFKDGDSEKIYKTKKELLEVLSTGEKRALVQGIPRLSQDYSEVGTIYRV